MLYDPYKFPKDNIIGLDDSLSERVAKTGDTMTGDLNIWGDNSLIYEGTIGMNSPVDISNGTTLTITVGDTTVYTETGAHKPVYVINETDEETTCVPYSTTSSMMIYKNHSWSAKIYKVTDSADLYVGGEIVDGKGNILSSKANEEDLDAKTNTSVIADDFSTITSYAVGDYCMRSGVLYKCTTAHTGTWDANDFTAVLVSDELGSGGSSVSPYTSNPAMDGVASAGLSDDYARGDHVHPSDTSKANASIIADAFDSTASYAEGDYVMYNGVFYKCTTAHTGAWDANNFRATLVSDEFGSGGSSETAECRYNIVTKSTGNYDAAITVKKYVDNVLESSTDYLYSDLQTPVVFDRLFSIGYGSMKYTMTLLESSVAHNAGYTTQWAYNSTVDFSETFVIDDKDISYIAPKFSASVAYAVGDLVTHEGKFYKCTTTHAAGAWNDAHFTVTTVDACLDGKLDTTAAASSVGHNLYIDLNQHSVGFNGYSEHTFRVLCIYAEISANNWSATVDSDGYYTNTITLSQAFSTYTVPFISCCGALGATDDPTSAQKAAYSLVDKFVFPDNLSSTTEMTVKAKTKPTNTFYVLVNGHKLT